MYPSGRCDDMKAILRDEIVAAPRGGHSEDEIARYASDEYLDREIHRAMQFTEGSDIENEESQT